MAIVIWKFPIENTDNIELEMPRGSKILSLKTQQGVPFIWAAVDTNNEIETRKFRIFGTGHEIPQGTHNLEYVDTYLIMGDTLVFHLFEEKPRVITSLEPLPEPPKAVEIETDRPEQRGESIFPD